MKRTDLELTIRVSAEHDDDADAERLEQELGEVVGDRLHQLGYEPRGLAGKAWWVTDWEVLAKATKEHGEQA